jgi:fumarylacetoacetate (FAA) hydrolase
MKLGSLKNKTPDGELVVVSRDNLYAVRVPKIAKTMLFLMENWKTAAPKLKEVYKKLNDGKIKDAFKVKEKDFHSPLPRTFQWLDGSAFIQHILLVRKARNAEPPQRLWDVPLMYQGLSDKFLAPYDDVPLLDESYGLDFEGEIGIVVDRVPLGTKASDAHKYIRLILLINDFSLRGIIPEELKMGFGFLQGKPASAHSPFALTLDELKDYFKEGKLHLPLYCYLNGKKFGEANASEMYFSFYQLIEHAAKTRELSPGTIIGSGTVSNNEVSKGQSCIVERRMLEIIQSGKESTPYMKIGDTIKIYMEDKEGKNLFGTIFQKVSKFKS